ncbi:MULTISPECIES: GAF domain-containing protein [Sulfurimonas]|uniref:GAF domain-containing protein n=1 Tax=Sulfurimonas TaxID=202746 RepID=UPI001264FDAA|nr:GAF domain-containing protein [Sulfurimonas indica]
MKENRYSKLSEFAKELLTKRSLEEGMPLIAKYVKDVIEAERCSIFIYDNIKHELWTTIADGVDRITLPVNKGLVGYTIKIKKPVIANDAYEHEEFLAEVDERTGYKTKNIVTAPIFDSERKIIGVLELLNKKDDFDTEDVKFMIFFAHYISGFLELLNIYMRKEVDEKI